MTTKSSFTYRFEPGALDHDEFGSLRSKLINVIDSNIVARESREKPVSTFSHPALAGAPPLLLLHGTGGDENDLLQLGQTISPGSALLSPRGRVLENGMPRFFRRFAEGKFDEEDVRYRANELADFVEGARERYGIGAPIAVGYSNGANIAAALLLLRPRVLAGAVLLRAMVPLSDPPKADLGGKPVLILSGQHDPIVPADNAQRLSAMLSKAGAKVDHQILPAGHQLSQTDIALAHKWIADVTLETAACARIPA